MNNNIIGYLGHNFVFKADLNNKKDLITPETFLVFITENPILGPSATHRYRAKPLENDNWEYGWWRDAVESRCNTGWDLEARRNVVQSCWLTRN